MTDKDYVRPMDAEHEALLKTALKLEESDELPANVVNIYWDFYDVPEGERMEGSPRYVLELWLCQNGQVEFAPRGANESSLQVTDEAGCAEPSHGRIYLAEVHGYIGPVEIPWPPSAAATP